MATPYILPYEESTPNDKEYFEKATKLKLDVQYIESRLRADYLEFCENLAARPSTCSGITTAAAPSDLSDVGSLPSRLSQLPHSLLLDKANQISAAFAAYGATGHLSGVAHHPEIDGVSPSAPSWRPPPFPWAADSRQPPLTSNGLPRGAQRSRAPAYLLISTQETQPADDARTETKAQQVLLDDIKEKAEQFRVCAD
ncbi:hypothetical protein ColTof4_14061 [Colletotrichum tofieldiae]|nr:hypothetical protein ColTof3_14698 [Colletotrichum tofieldiae]GKT81638.1 hypothetical protein ColTof4_14061 [Colletotrichum tofieldiae]GKT97613.1 hypothetical protein Ct61P_15463 [Colletotrichum tofieldiae]